MKDKFFISLLVLLFILIKKTISKFNKDKKGKCVYFLPGSDSEVMNFHKYTNKNLNQANYIFAPKKNDTENKKWYINLCNDTFHGSKITITNSTGGNETLYIKVNKTQIAYCVNYNECVKFTSGFHRPFDETGRMYYSEVEEAYIFRPSKGDNCSSDNDRQYQIDIVFNDSLTNNSAIITDLPEKVNCNDRLVVQVNFDYAKDYLILERVLNDYYIFTGILFVVTGIFLCFFSLKYTNANKVVIALTFSEIVVFLFGLVILNLYSKNAEIYLIIIGIVLGGILGFFLIVKNIKFYNMTLAVCGGFIFGIFIFDIIFAYNSYQLIFSLFADCLIVFISVAIGVIILFPKKNFYLNSIIGGYVLIRGVSLFVYNGFDSIRFRDLQIIFYLISRYELEFNQYFLDKEFQYSWFYDFIIGLTMILSGAFYYLVCSYTGIDEEEEKDDDVEEREESVNSDNK